MGLPLVSVATLDDLFALTPAGPRRVRDFVADSLALAAQLPSGGWMLNVCQDRYRFAVGFAAGLLTGKTSLQPASQSAETFQRLLAEYPDVFCLADSAFESQGVPRFEFPGLETVAPGTITEIPEIDEAALAAILFTSGSTGLPQPHRKTWGKLVLNGRAEAIRLGLLGHPHLIVGTVPVQHAYGFESTCLLALHGGCPFWSGKPFYPQDIVSTLAAVPRPRLLVTTPYHLSSLLAADVSLPETDLLLSATAPLSMALASEAEMRFGTPLMEIYGSTETGQIACRRPVEGPVWHLLPGLSLQQQDETTTVEGGHVEGRMPLSDIIECLDDGRFLLHGRQADLINIAGKRTSVSYLNHQIAAVPGVMDAAFFLPDEPAGEGVTRLCAFVVAPTLSRQALMTALRKRIDAIFLPRPLIFVDALPRNSTGKLPRSQLQHLYESRLRDEA